MLTVMEQYSGKTDNITTVNGRGNAYCRQVLKFNVSHNTTQLQISDNAG